MPVIACTANTFEQDKRDAAEAGMNDHLAKPFKPDALVEIIRKYV
ncbi:response regulator [Lachnoclostridium sp. MSJ-17]